MKPWAATRQRLRGIAWVLVGGSVVFAGIATGRAFGPAGLDALTLPLALLASAGLIAVALLTRWYPVRPIAQGLAVFGALVHLLVLLRSGPIWTRGCSAVLTVTHIYALVMLFVVSAQESADDPDPQPTPRVDDPSTPSRQFQHTESAVSAPADAPLEQESAGERVSAEEQASDREVASDSEEASDAPAEPEASSSAEPVRVPEAESDPVPEASTEEREPVESAVGSGAEHRPASPEENK